MGLELLAQTAETVDKSLGFLERINAGGVPLLALVFAVIAAVVAFKFYRDKDALETAFRDRVQELLKDQIKASADSATSQAKASQVIETFQKDATEMKDRLLAVENKLTAVEMELKLLKEKISD